MKINIKLDPDFSYELTKLKAKYGDEIAKLNGLSDSQLDYTDFIDNFIDTKTVADASVDANANVTINAVKVIEETLKEAFLDLTTTMKKFLAWLLGSKLEANEYAHMASVMLELI